MNIALQLLTARGEHSSCGFSLFAIDKLSDVKITLPELRDNKGNKIDVKELSVLEFAPAGSIPRYASAQLLYKADFRTIAAGEQVNLILMINVPENTPGGLYTGQIKISSGSQAPARLNVMLRVMDFTLPEAGNFGFYINGNLYNPQIHKEERIMQTGFVKENLKKYFDFYKTRRFNSICMIDFPIYAIQTSAPGDLTICQLAKAFE